MIYVTGDTHGSLDYNKIHCMRKRLRKDDFLIIAGDFGAVWHKNTLRETLKIYERLKCRVLFADGNHENFELLNSFPSEIWQGGKVHKIAENVYHLMRGQVFGLEGKKFFVLGGAETRDKYRRREGVSWWKEESVTYADIDESLKNLAACGNEVDFVITHTLPSRLLYRPPFYELTGGRADVSEMMLNIIADQISFKHWYFGHWHFDGEIGPLYTAVYRKVIALG